MECKGGIMEKTIKDVAAAAGVSPSTVSRVLNNTATISDETKKRVMDAVREMGYSPSRIASSLSKKKSSIIGVIIPDICNTFFSRIFYAASQVAHENNYRLFLCNTDDQIDLEADALRDMMAYRVGGIIMTPMSEGAGDNEKLIRQVQDSGIPIVFVDREMKNIRCDGVFINNVQSSCEMTRLLIDQGHKDIAIIAGPQDTIPGRERMQGYRLAMSEAGLTPKAEHIVMADFRDKTSYDATIKLLTQAERPTAIFSCNNLMTVGCLRALKDLKLQVPGDVALVGFDEVDFLDILGYPLTVVSRPTSEMGSIAMRLLLDRIHGGENKAYQRVMLQSYLKVAGSERMP